jgi:hypothetical protein
MSHAQLRSVEKGDAPSLDGITPFTRHEHWRLRFGKNTRKEWVYLHSDEDRNAWPQSNLEKHVLGLPVVCARSLYHLTVSSCVFRLV